MNEDINVGKDFNGHVPVADRADGPKNIAEMTDRELLEELVMTTRTLGAAMATFQKVGPMGMMKAVMTGGFPKV